MSDSGKVVHINTWEGFKSLAVKLHPSSIAYTVQTSPLSRPPLGLRLVFASEGVQYVFLDFAHGNAFWRTKLPVHNDSSGVAYFEEEDLKNFIHTELNRQDISIFSFEVLGY